MYNDHIITVENAGAPARPAPHQIDRANWFKLDLWNQLGNISSEVGRSISAYRTGKIDRANSAIDRALDLFDATAEYLRTHGELGRLREIMLAKEQYLNLFYADTFAQDADNIERYFMNFAYIARTRGGVVAGA